MTQDPHPNIASEFRELGKNLKNILQTAWESEEAHQFKQELKTGLTDLGKAATEAVNEFNASETSQRLKSDVQDFKARVESGEVETKARGEVFKALQTINAELEKVAAQWFESPAEAGETTPDAGMEG